MRYSLWNLESLFTVYKGTEEYSLKLSHLHKSHKVLELLRLPSMLVLSVCLSVGTQFRGWTVGPVVDLKSEVIDAREFSLGHSIFFCISPHTEFRKHCQSVGNKGLPLPC